MRRVLPTVRFAAVPSILVAAVLSAGVAHADVDPATLPAVSYQPGGIAYWDRPQFANALLAGDGWNNNWTMLPSWNTAQFDENGYPRNLVAGQVLQAVVSGLHSGYAGTPAGWPDVRQLWRGHVVLTWQGNADIRLEGTSGTYLASESSGAETGPLLNGRRVYRITDPPGWIRVYSIATPITDIKLWLPDPADPQNQSLEGQFFHPSLLARIGEAPWRFIRFMDWNVTNASPVQTWPDRRRPSHVFGTGVLNPRAPAVGFAGNRETGLAYEHMVALANLTQKDLWINVPHMATDDFVTKLAQLIRYGSDGTNPYTAPVASPIWAPLAPERQVYVEYSNEIWAGGDAFAQGDWAQARADAAGISKERWNARRFCELWRIFQSIFGGSQRIVRVAAVWTALESYTGPFLQEMRDYGPTLSPAVEPDIVAMTTYFGNGIQDWIHAKAQQQAGTSDAWFYTGATFDPGDGSARPVSLPASDPYWTSAAYARHKSETFAEWKKRMLAGSASEGGGPDATGLGGGFDVWLADLARTTFAAPKPLVAYEGGPSLYTNYLDGGDTRDDGITWFTSAINREPAIRELYDIHLNMARSKGLRTHSAFVDCSIWGKYGQWGHLESLDQPLASAPKHAFLLDYAAETARLRAAGDPLGTVPAFATAPTLPPALYATPYSVDLVASGGNGTLTASVIGTSLAAGLTAEPLAGGTVRLHGIPQAAGTGYVYVRVDDADGDSAWRIFTLRVAGGPGVLVDADLRGTDPALHTPWTPVYYLASSLSSYSGLTGGPGAQGAAGNDRFVYAFDTPSTPATLAQALADGEYVAASVATTSSTGLGLRSGAVRFTIDRLDYHAPRRYAVFTSVAGFGQGQQVFTSEELTDQNEPRDFAAKLPDLAAYDSAQSMVVRIYGFGGQYGGHRTSLTAFSLGRAVAPGPTVSIDNASTTEGQSGTKTLQLTIRLSGPSTSPATVDWTTAP